MDNTIIKKQEDNEITLDSVIDENKDTVENTDDKKKKKNKKAPFLIVGAVILVIAVVFCVIFGVAKSKADTIADSLVNKDVSAEHIEFQYDSFPGVIKVIAKPMLKKTVIETVKDNPYIYTEDKLVDIDVIAIYKKCDVLSGRLNLAEDSSTNVDEYISEIMKIAEYEADGNCINMLAATVDDVETIVETWNSMLRLVNTYSGTSAVLGNAYWSSALTDLKTMKEKSENAVKIAKQFNYTDEKSKKFIADLEYIRDNIGMAITDTTIQWNIRDRFEAIKTMGNNALVIQNEIKLIVEGLPELY